MAALMGDTPGPDAMSLQLPAAANLEAACQFVDTLADADPHAPLLLDAGAVETLSTPYVLALISAINSRSENAPKVVVSNPTAAFMDAFSDLGLFSDLMKMEFAT